MNILSLLVIILFMQPPHWSAQQCNQYRREFRDEARAHIGYEDSERGPMESWSRIDMDVYCLDVIAEQDSVWAEGMWRRCLVEERMCRWGTAK